MVGIQAQLRPTAVAVVDGRVRTTYAQLDAASNEYSAVLQDAGVRPGDLIPVVRPRSAQLVALLLGVLKVGAAYAVLDAAWPLERRRRLVDQMDPPLVIGHPDEAFGRRVWLPAAETPADAAARGGVPLPVEVMPSDPSTVFFTSGSSGTPKGIVSTHLATTRLVADTGIASFSAPHAMPQGAPLPWDGLTLELWPMLCGGGTSVMVQEPHLTPSGLRQLINDVGVDTVWLTASLFNVFVEEALDAFVGLRTVLIGGEALSRKHVLTFLEAYPSIRLVNGYGPAESCVFSTTHLIRRVDCEDPSGIPIGLPVLGTTVHVMNGMTVVQDGSIGELCVGGEGLAVGYLGQPDATRDAFVQVEIEGDPVRVYRTGDLGWVGEDGLFHYAGRIDRQVKVRGIRIELDEIDRVAQSLPRVQWARAVAVHKGDSADVDSLALFFLSDDDDLGPDDVRSGLGAVLASGTIPSEIVRVETIPLTANGKTDHRALLALLVGSRVEASPVSRFEAPMDGVTAEFARLLGRAVPDDADFFDMGGTSLDATRLVARLSTAFDVVIPMSRFLEEPTPAGVRKIVCLTQPPVHGSAPSPVAPMTSTQRMFLYTHLIEVHQDLASLCPLMWRVDEDISAQVLASAMGDVVARHGALRSAYRSDDGGTVRPATVRPVRVVDHGELASMAEAVECVARSLEATLAVSSGELVRGARARVCGSTVVGVVVHHIAFDGWSEAILVEDLGLALAARLQGAAPVFTEVVSNIADVLHESEAVRQAADVRAQLDFWRDELTGVPDLVFDFQSSVTNSPTAEHRHLRLPEPAVAKLKVWMRKHGASDFIGYMAIFVRALKLTVGQDDFALGVPFAQRGGEHAQRAIACLVGVLPIRVRDLQGEEMADVVASTREVVRRAMGNQDVGLPEILRVIGRKGTGRHPVFQVMFALQDNVKRPLVVGRGQAERLDLEPAVSMHELVFEVRPQDDGAVDAHVSFDPRRVRGWQVDDLIREFKNTVEGLHQRSTEQKSAWPASSFPSKDGVAHPARSGEGET